MSNHTKRLTQTALKKIDNFVRTNEVFKNLRLSTRYQMNLGMVQGCVTKYTGIKDYILIGDSEKFHVYPTKCGINLAWLNRYKKDSAFFVYFPIESTEGFILNKDQTKKILSELPIISRKMTGHQIEVHTNTMLNSHAWSLAPLEEVPNLPVNKENWSNWIQFFKGKTLQNEVMISYLNLAIRIHQDVEMEASVYDRKVVNHG